MTYTTNSPQKIIILEVRTSLPLLAYVEPVQIQISGATLRQA